MNILFLHPNMPGQYKHLARHFGADKNNRVVFITKPRPGVDIPGVRKVGYKLLRDASPATHRYLIGTEKAVLQGQEVWRMCKKLKSEGFVPDVVCAHPGWGDALYIKDIYPGVPVLSFFEFYYGSDGADVAFDPDDPIREDDKARIRTKNITNLLSLESADWGITPTHWQFSRHPGVFQHKISVLHDGIDTSVAAPGNGATITLKDSNATLKQGDEIATYIARNFEPYRGFPTFMQAAEIILKSRPNCHIIALGADDVSYGKRPQGNKTYRQQWMEKVKLDTKRIHFVGTLPYTDMIKIMQLSSAHIYLTYPFVLSWSMLEAMSCGCLLIGSNTQPVAEVIRDGHNGLLVDFFSPEQVAARAIEALDRPERFSSLRKNARQTVLDRYDLKKILPLQVGLIEDLARGELPPQTAKKIKELGNM